MAQPHPESRGGANYEVYAKMEERECSGDVFAFIRARKTPFVFLNDENRKTATQTSQKPKNRTIFWQENENRTLLLKP